MFATPPFEVALAISTGFVFLVIFVVVGVREIIRRRRGG
jgi:hypothetical protein